MPEQELLSFNEDGFQYAWDATSLTNFMKCPRYYQYVNLEGWQPKQKSVHLIYGGLYATALEHFFKHVALGDSHLDALDKVLDEILQETWIRTEEDPEGSPWLSGHDKKTRETLVRTIIWYIDQYVLDALGDKTEVIVLNNGKPAVELSFSVPFGNEYLWCGHIDRMVTYEGNNYVMDQKTTGSAISAYYFKGFLLDAQMSGYSMAGQIAFNVPVKGVIIDAAQILVGGTKFGRGFVNRSASQLEEFREYAHYYIEEAKRAHDSGYYPMNTNSCMNYGGCAFQKICERSPVHRPNFLTADFERRERWDPLKRR